MPEANADEGSASPRWLSLKQASRFLGVHPATLRRWADQGQIPVLVTPGGHRRFAFDDLVQFTQTRRQTTALVPVEQVWTDRALIQTRSKLTAQAPRWLAAFSDEDREHKRQLGRRLMGLVLQYVNVGEAGGEALIAEARAIGQEHARNSLGLGLPLATAIEVALFFRDTMMEVALRQPEGTPARSEDNTRLMRRINRVLNEVQLAVIATYERELIP